MKTLTLTDIVKIGHHWWHADFLKYYKPKNFRIF